MGPCDVTDARTRAEAPASLLKFLQKTRKAAVCTDLEGELSEATIVHLPGITPGTNWERFRAKATAYLKQHEDRVAFAAAAPKQAAAHRKSERRNERHCLTGSSLYSPAGRVPITSLAARRTSSSPVSPHRSRSTSSLCSPSVGGGRVSHSRWPASRANGGVG